ncbi:MAG: transglycosylase SLT domain-containing protein [Magnetococcus sp. WYHC-3]
MYDITRIIAQLPRTGLSRGAAANSEMGFDKVLGQTVSAREGGGIRDMGVLDRQTVGDLARMVRAALNQAQRHPGMLGGALRAELLGMPPTLSPLGGVLSELSQGEGVLGVARQTESRDERRQAPGLAALTSQESEMFDTMFAARQPQEVESRLAADNGDEAVLDRRNRISEAARLAQAGAAQRETQRVAGGGTPYADLIGEAARVHGLDERLVAAVVEVESGFNPRAQSRVGAQGLMQLMPETAQELGVSDAFDPRQNLMAGSLYLRKLMDRYQGDQDLALAAYNWGMGNLERRPEAMPAETRNYIAKVTRILADTGTTLA